MQSLRDGTRWMLRLDDGQDLFPTLSEFFRGRSIRAGAIVSGIGMLKTASVGYWTGSEYRPHDLTVPHELIALHGSVAEVEGAPSVHLHAALAGPKHECVAGHLLRGTVGILAEVYVETFDGHAFGRPMNESLGLRTLDLEPGPTG